MNYMSINKADTANGDGIRTSLWVAGCSFACKGCFNREAWSYKAGKKFTQDTLNELMAALEHTDGLSVLGGEPLEPRNIDQVINIVRHAKKFFPEKDIWLWTGYEAWDLFMNVTPEHNKKVLEVMKYIDCLIDGKYDSSKPTTKPYRGSDNQQRFKRDPDQLLHFRFVD